MLASHPKETCFSLKSLTYDSLRLELFALFREDLASSLLLVPHELNHFTLDFANLGNGCQDLSLPFGYKIRRITKDLPPRLKTFAQLVAEKRTSGSRWSL